MWSDFFWQSCSAVLGFDCIAVLSCEALLHCSACLLCDHMHAARVGSDVGKMGQDGGVAAASLSPHNQMPNLKRSLKKSLKS